MALQDLIDEHLQLRGLLPALRLPVLANHSEVQHRLLAHHLLHLRLQQIRHLFLLLILGIQGHVPHPTLLLQLLDLLVEVVGLLFVAFFWVRELLLKLLFLLKIGVCFF